jgi:hypothetical protein
VLFQDTGDFPSVWESTDSPDGHWLNTPADDHVSSGDNCIISSEEMDTLNDNPIPFENLVFEGEGNKGLAFCGAVRFC